jgi:hypothetical protein
MRRPLRLITCSAAVGLSTAVAAVATLFRDAFLFCGISVTAAAVSGSALRFSPRPARGVADSPGPVSAFNAAFRSVAGLAAAGVDDSTAFLGLTAGDSSAPLLGSGGFLALFGSLVSFLADCGSGGVAGRGSLFFLADCSGVAERGSLFFLADCSGVAGRGSLFFLADCSGVAGRGSLFFLADCSGVAGRGSLFFLAAGVLLLAGAGESTEKEESTLELKSKTSS